MKTLQKLPERARELATRVGDGLRDRVPDRAVRWVETGAALGALKTGTRVAARVARRNPLLLAAAVAGAGLLWYGARRRARNAATAGAQHTGEDAAREGASTHVEARRESSSAARARRARSGNGEASASAAN